MNSHEYAQNSFIIYLTPVYTLTLDAFILYMYYIFAFDVCRKFQDMSQKYQNMQSSQSTSTESELKIKV